MMKKKKKIYITILLFLFLALGLFLYIRFSLQTMRDSLSFNLKDGFYDKKISVSMQTRKCGLVDGKIRYTLNGDTPTASASVYSSPLSFVPDDTLKAVTIRAAVFVNDQMLGSVKTATFLIGKDNSALADALIISITSDNSGLFSESNGILYPAKSFGKTETDEDWLAFTRMNYKQRGDDWIRQAHVNMFDRFGNEIIDQDCGLAVDGNHGSMTHYPFSLKLLAGKDYDTSHTVFDYDFFSYSEKNTSGSLYTHAQKFNSLVLRNGGNEYLAGANNPDVRGTMIRQDFVSQMAEETGFMTLRTRPAIVFLNGSFYNVTQIQDSYNYKNIAALTGFSKQSLNLFKGSEVTCADAADYKSLYLNYPEISKAEIATDPLKKKEFEDLFDMNELFRYYAFELLIQNSDWPWNNYGIWRYSGKQSTASNPYSDGRFRFLIFDLDCAYGFRDEIDPWDAIFHNLNKNNCELATILQSKENKCRFFNALCDMLSTGVFDPDYVNLLIDEADARFRKSSSAFYSAEDEACREQNVSLMKKNTVARMDYIKSVMKRDFTPKNPYTLQIAPPVNGAVILLNTQKLASSNGTFEGTYYGNYPITLSCQSSDFSTFAYWLVNGEKIAKKDLSLDSLAIKNGKIKVSLVTKETANADLVLSELYKADGKSWIEVYNPTSKAIALKEYSFSHSDYSLAAISLPDVMLSSQKAYAISIPSDGTLPLNEKDTIYLKHFSNIADSLAIPAMDSKESYGRYGETNEYHYYVKPTKGSPQ